MVASKNFTGTFKLGIYGLSNSNITRTITNTLERVLGVSAALHEPLLKGNEWDYIKECLDTGWVSSVGKYVDKFEKDLAEYTGVDHAVATVNGTAALHSCLLLGGVGPDDEVIVPALTFVATANAVSYVGAIPHFADSDMQTLGIDPQKLDNHLEATASVENDLCINTKSGRVIRAVICMHTFGHPVDLDSLIAICQKWNLVLIEDAAESLGSAYKGKHTGGFGHLAALSFNGNKTITTGGGGAILTNDDELARKAKHQTTTAKTPHAWEYSHDMVGYNYRMPNVNAALGVAQLEQLPNFVERKRNLAAAYKDAFAEVGGLSFFTEPDFARSNYWLNLIILNEDRLDNFEEILKATNDAGFMTRPVWRPMHQLEMYFNCPRMNLDVAESLSKRIINIPSSPVLGSA